MTLSSRTVIPLVALAAMAIALWFLLVAPKRERASELGAQVEQLESAVAQKQQEADLAEQAKEGYPDDYHQLVLLGKAVPGDDATGSLLVEVSRVATDARVEFRDIALDETTAEAAPAATALSTTDSATPASSTAAPTEASAALLPLGAAVGSAGLGVMPYELTFRGDFFRVADFIEGLDELVDAEDGRVVVDGRLVTIDGFSLVRDERVGFPNLLANFSVTTYLTPPGQGATAGATPTSPAAPAPAAVANDAATSVATSTPTAP